VMTTEILRSMIYRLGIRMLMSTETRFWSFLMLFLLMRTSSSLRSAPCPWLSLSFPGMQSMDWSSVT
jgi:hypothetical protein